MQILPEGKIYRPLLKLIEIEIPDFYSNFNENDRQFFLKEPNEKLSNGKQDQILKMAKNNKPLQVALLHTKHLDKLHIAKMFDDFVYRETKLEALRTGNVSDDVIISICESLSLPTLNTFFKKHEKEISHITFNAITKKVTDKIKRSGKDCELEQYELVALKKYNSPIVHNKLIREVINTYVNKDIITALLNNENISAQNRDVLAKREYDIYNIENPTPELLSSLYMGAVETLFDIKQSEKTPTAQAMAETFIIKMIKNGHLTKDMQMDLMCRIINDDTFKYSVPSPILTELIKNTTYDDVAEFYASGALGKPKPYRDLLFNNNNLPVETVLSLMAIIFDNIKETGKIEKDEYDFVINQIHLHKYRDIFYIKFFEMFYDKDINKAKNNTEIEYKLKFIAKNVAISKHTPDYILDKMSDIGCNSVTGLAMLNKGFRENMTENLSDVFFINEKATNMEIEKQFYIHENMISNDYFKKLSDTINKTKSLLLKYMDEKSAETIIDEYNTTLKQAQAKLYLKSNAKDSLIRDLIADIRKNDTIYNFYIKLPIYVNELEKIDKVPKLQVKKFKEITENMEKDNMTER